MVWPRLGLRIELKKVQICCRLSRCATTIGRRCSAQSSAACPKTAKGEVMTQYLVAIHLPDDFDPSVQDKSMERDIDALNEEMEAKGVRLFAGGLGPASEAKSLRIFELASTKALASGVI